MAVCDKTRKHGEGGHKYTTLQLAWWVGRNECCAQNSTAKYVIEYVSDNPVGYRIVAKAKRTENAMAEQSRERRASRRINQCETKTKLMEKTE